MKIDNRLIYEQIGNLFYAIAAEQHVKPLEVAELKLLISNDWLPRTFRENESVISDETHYILITMDALEGNQTSPKDAFREFSRFYANHQEVFTIEVKQRIFDTAVDINRIFKAYNPMENIHISALESMLGLSKAGKVK